MGFSLLLLLHFGWKHHNFNTDVSVCLSPCCIYSWFFLASTFRAGKVLSLVGNAYSFTLMHPFLVCLLVQVELGLTFKDVVRTVHEGPCMLGASFACTRETSLSARAEMFMCVSAHREECLRLPLMLWTPVYILQKGPLILTLLILDFPTWGIHEMRARTVESSVDCPK